MADEERERGERREERRVEGSSQHMQREHRSEENRMTSTKNGRAKESKVGIDERQTWHGEDECKIKRTVGEVKEASDIAG